MLVSALVRRCFAAFCGFAALGCSACSSSVSNDATMAELGRLRAAVRQSEERMAVMQAHQQKLMQQLAVLSAFVGAMAQDASVRRDEMARKKESFAGNAATTVSIPAQPTAPVPPPPDLEF